MMLQANTLWAGDDLAEEPEVLPALHTAGIVHDLGNLIQIATAALNVVARTPEMPAIHAGPMLDRARTCLEHAGELVRQNIGLLRRHEAASDVVACLSDVASLVEAMHEPGLLLRLDIETHLPRVACDSMSLRRAILNLVLNARDAIAGGGTITLAARAVVRGPAAPAVQIRVIDDGVGMTPTTIARALDPHFTTKRDGLGGIGLPMVDRFVREAGGHLAIDSEPGIGTAITLRLPAYCPLREETKP